MRFFKWLHPGLHIKRWLFPFGTAADSLHTDFLWQTVDLSRLQFGAQEPICTSSAPAIMLLIVS